MSEYAFPYLNSHQSRMQEPTQWQMELAAAIENIFSRGATSINELVDGLNNSRVKLPDGGPWTTERYITLMQELEK